MATYDIDSLPTSFNVGDIIDCPYSGTIKSIALPKGKYKFELWGGGIQAKMDPDKPTPQGNGGYTVGNYTVSNPTILYLVSGGKGTFGINSGYNGGGSVGGNPTFNGISPQIFLQQMSKSTRGGGATHIALVPGLLSEIGANNLSSILAVAGGAGGPNVYKKSGTNLLTSSSLGVGGGTTGLPSDFVLFTGLGGTQSAGGAGGRFLQQMFAEDGSFGKGGSGVTTQYTEFILSNDASASISMYASGGGGGLYGGGGATPIYDSEAGFVALANAGGGSGYVSDTLEEAATYNTDDNTPEPPVGTYGDGHIRITVLSIVHQNTIVKANETWEDCTPLVKANNTWKDVDKAFVKVDGVWQPVINNEQPPIVKCAEFSTTDNSNFNSSSFHISHGYLSFKILTNDPFLFNIDVEFSGATFAWYTVGIHSSTTPSVVSNYNYFTIDNPILDDIETSYTGPISIPGGNINKYIVIYFDKDSGDGGLSGTFEFLSNYYSGGIYMSSDSIYKSFTFCEKTFWFIDGMTWQDWLNSSLDTSTHGMVLDPPYDEIVEGRGHRIKKYTDSFYISSDSGEALICYGWCFWDADYTGDRDTYMDLAISLNGSKGHNVAPTDKIISTTYVEGTSFNYY